MTDAIPARNYTSIHVGIRNLHLWFPLDLPQSTFPVPQLRKIFRLRTDVSIASHQRDILLKRSPLSNIFLPHNPLILPVRSPPPLPFSPTNDRQSVYIRTSKDESGRRVIRTCGFVRCFATCLPTVITCHSALPIRPTGKKKNLPIAINHGELEKTADLRARYPTVSVPLCLSSLSIVSLFSPPLLYRCSSSFTNSPS